MSPESAGVRTAVACTAGVCTAGICTAGVCTAGVSPASVVVRMRGVVVALLVTTLLVALFAAGCDNETRAPRAALRRFLMAMAAGDAAASYAYLSSADKEQLDLAAWSRDEERLAHAVVTKQFHFIMSDAAVDGDSATVEILIGDDDDAGDAQDLKFLMVKEGGEWKVSFLKTMAGPLRLVKTGGGINWSHVAFGSGSESTARSIVYLVMFLAVYAFYGIGLQRVARLKRLRHPWFAWVPVLNIYIAWKIAGKGVFSTVLSLIPFVNVVMYVLFCFKFSRACGKGRLFGLLQLIPVVNLVVFWLLVENVEDSAGEAALQPA